MTKVHLLTSMYTSKKQNLFVREHTFLDSALPKLDLLQLLTYQFSALEPFPIPNLPADFSQQGATNIRESYIRVRLK